MNADPKRKLNTDEAAKHLGVTHRVLADLRSKGGGPPYFKIGGRCIYQLVDLDTWLATKRATGTPKNASEPRPIGRPTPLDAYA